MHHGTSRGGAAWGGGSEFGPEQLFVVETSDRNRPLLRSAPDGSVPPTLRRPDGRFAEHVRLYPANVAPAPTFSGAPTSGAAMVLLDAFATVAGHAVVAFFKQYRSNRAREEYGRLLALEVSRREAAEKREAAERVAREVAEARLAELEALRAPTPPVGGRRASWPSAPVQAQERNDQPPAAQRFDLDQFRVRSAESLPG